MSYIKDTMSNAEVINIIVDKNGYGDYTTVTDAINSIKDSSKDKIYNVYITKGDYNIAGEQFPDGDYSEVKKGILLPDYVNLIGLGKCEDVILRAEFPETISLDLSTQFSTINIEQNNDLINIYFIAKNCRYACHDESGSKYKNYRRNVYNCIFHHKGVDKTDGTLWKWADGYGHGLSEGAICDFSFCKFITDVTIAGNGGYICHDNSDWQYPAKLKFDSCIFENTQNNMSFRVGTVGSGVDNIINFNGCTFTGNSEGNIIIQEESGYSGVGIDFKVFGVACKNPRPKVVRTDGKTYTPYFVASELVV